MTMSPSNPNPPRTLDEQLELYVEGLLPASEAASFEAVMRGDAVLRARVAEARAADDAIRAAFQAPAIAMRVPEDLSGASRVAESMIRSDVVGTIGNKRVPWWVTVASLAAMLALAVGVWTSMNRKPAPTFLAPDEVFSYLARGGFKPQFICENDEEFKTAVDNRFGQPLLIAASPDIQLLGWAYSNVNYGLTLGKKCLILMATVRGEQALLFMDNTSEDRPLKIAEGSSLRLHRGVIGDMVLYELSPFEQPELLPRTYDPDKGGPPGTSGSK